MPYIKKEDRARIVYKGYAPDRTPQIDIEQISTGGELQYAIAVMLKDMLSRLPDNYASREMILGALAGAQAEFYRRTVAPYEDKKIEENGDV